ncbi:MAG: hypothetical protein JOZ02_15230 [Acidobacteria bacterium]|nr:hypothetical protein [Acidobacteriota bacterium]
MRRFLVCAALLWLAAARAAGQGGSVEESRPGALPSFVRLGDAGAEARRLLQSGENRERAWGAYLTGLHGLESEAPRLVELLADPALAGGGWEAALVRQAALDALIRLDAKVPAEKLLPLYASAPDEVIILLAREPQENQPALLSLFDDATPTAHWLAVGNLLAETRAPGFAARLLAGLKIEARVYVYDREGDRGYGGGCGGCGGGYDNAGPWGEYPPIFYYFLTTSNARGAVVAAPGRHTVYYERTTSPARGCGVRGCGPSKDQYRVGYVADLLGTSEEELKLEAKPFREVICKDARQCRRALLALRDEFARAHAEAVGRLLEAGLLDAAEAADLKPDTTLRLYDSRERLTFPLPSKLKGVKVEVYGDDPEPPAAPKSSEASPDAPR